MALDPYFIPAFSLETVFLDKDTGEPLSGGLVYFYEDAQRGNLKPVYQLTGTSPNYQYTQLPNPMTLSSIGTFQDSLGNPIIPYFFPFNAQFEPEYYFVYVTDAGGVEQMSREAVPYIPQELNPSERAISYTNELSNPQFADVSFDTSTATYTYNFTGAALEAVELAPGWDLVVTGTGTVTVSQETPQGQNNLPTNPGTYLKITSAGITVLRLRQRLFGSPNLFANSRVSFTMMAATDSGSAVVSAYYLPSSGIADPGTLIGDMTLTTTFGEKYANVLIPASASPDTFPDGYVDIFLSLPVSTTLNITSIQLVSTGDTAVSNVPYDQVSNERQTDFLYWFDKPLLEYKPIPSILTAWDFPLNPAQARGTSMNIEIAPTAANCYIWDQLISKSVAGNVAVARNAVTGGIQCTTANNNEAFYFLQYLSGNQAKEILGTRLSVNINAWRTQAGGDVTVHAYLYRGSSSASIPSLPTIIGTVNANGIFSLSAANWSEIERSNLGTAVGTLSTVRTTNYEDLNDVVDLSFNGWEITSGAEIADTDKFAIVVTFSCPTTGTVVVVDSISCVKGDIPTRPAPQTPDEVIRECAYYYETSKNVGVAITTSSGAGALLRQMASFQQSPNVVAMWPRSFGIEWNVVKRVAPIVSLYSEGGASGNVTAFIYQGGAQIATSVIALSSAWTAANGGQKGIEYLATYTDTGTGLIPISIFTLNNTTHSFISFHYEADARLGIV